MQLREHPLLSRDAQHGWPPNWIKVSGPGPNLSSDESGVLSSIILSRLDPPAACFLLVEHGPTCYMDTLGCDDPVREIGSINLPSATMRRSVQILPTIPN